MSTANDRFKEAVTANAFFLHLTKQQVFVLCQIDSGFSQNEYHHVTVQALERKGLIEHRGELLFLSDAGKMVIPLLELSGLTNIQENEYVKEKKGMQEAVRGLLSQGLKQSEIVKQLSLSKGYVSRIANGLQ